MTQFINRTKALIYHWGLLSLFSLAVVGFIACGEEKRERPDVVKETPSSSSNSSISNQDVANTPSNMNSNNASTGDVQHYICPNDCEGSGGASQGTCPVCGTAYVHNQAFHNQGNQAPQNQINLEGGDDLQNLQQPQQPSSPPQNADGEYHYICSAGCSGGSGSAGTCSKCGASLAHNSAYHN
jgi:hypothetical protein